MKRNLTILIALALTLTISAQEWTTKAAMPTPRSYADCAVINNQIYVIGGYNAIGPSTKVEVYNPETNTWTTKKPMPTARGGVNVVAVNGKIYAIGGWTTPNNILNTVEEYDPTTDLWTVKPTLLVARNASVAGVINNKIYIAGGLPTGMSSTEEYDPATGVRTAKASLSLGRSGAPCSIIIDGKFYFIGGVNSANMNSGFKVNECYDPLTNLWTVKADLPEQRFNGAAAVLNNEIHYLGGSAFSTPCDGHFIYNPTTNSWKTGLKMTQARTAPVSATVNGKIYLIGGAYANGQNVELNEEYSPISTGISTPTISSLTLYPNPAHDFLNISIGDLNPNTRYSLKIKNTLGQTGYSATISEASLKVDLSNCSVNGVCFVELLDEVSRVVCTKKILIK